MVVLLLTILGLGAPARASLPRLALFTERERPVDSREDFVDAVLTVDANGQDPRWSTRVATAVRGRGNSTWDMPKRPYKLRLERAIPLLGLPAHRDWSLLANYADKTLLRNLLANFMGARLSFAFTPRNRSVLLNLNGVDLGAYVLTEEVDFSPERLDVPRDDDTGGYLLEIDERRASPHRFETVRGTPYAILRPRRPTEAQGAFIRGYVQKVEDVINDSKPPVGYEKWIDVESFVDAYLVNEILKNSDAANFSSIFMHKGSGQRLAMGPLWDYDLAAGNTDYTEAGVPTGWWIRTQSPWYRALFTDSAFEDRVRNRWRSLAGLGLGLDDLKAFVDRTALELEEAQRQNFSLWRTLDTYVWPNAVVTGSYAGEIDYLKSWLTVRMRWMDMQLK